MTPLPSGRNRYTIARSKPVAARIAIAAAYGLFAGAMHFSGTTELGADAAFAVAVFVVAYFTLSRALLYFSLLVRDKLMPDERALILRYELVTSGAATAAACGWLASATNRG